MKGKEEMTKHTPENVVTFYKDFWSTRYADFSTQLDQSQSIHPLRFLTQKVAALGINKHASVLDAGCGWGEQSCALATHLGCRMTGLDLTEGNLALARNRAAQMGVGHLTTFLQGNILALPFETGTFDLAYCCESLPHVTPLQQGLTECARILKPGGTLLIIHSFATSSLGTEEADYLYSIGRVAAENMSVTSFEQALKASSLQISSSEILGSRYYEYYFEPEYRDSPEYREAKVFFQEDALLKLARLRSKKEALVAEFGQEIYNSADTVLLWHIDHLMGKLASVVYIARKPM
jgi:ubiquinone/menaquinone biosynthesis C-methylase UbiE